MIHGNVIYDIFESHAFHLLGLFSTLESEEFEKFDKVAASAAANLHWTRINARAPDGTNNNFLKGLGILATRNIHNYRQVGFN